MCCKKDMSITKNLGADGEGKEVVIPNLHCVKLCQSLKSRGYVREQFNWCVRSTLMRNRLAVRL